ncbi:MULTISPECIES: efflux RND transporter periplasmic adaptor subunit [Massilia]|uniref:Efflux transporter, RND family, MFP subunit n=1 Tax=Massilia timonae TaxID=47229 RepID=A0A1S2NC45_9BURK|nr:MULTISPECIES: efflux RND transporter periplasmic adaptor subunit [Massilia]OIJ42657.1 efflux transporter, RND family, MFP subunit [Massilia timonae]
MQALLRSAVCAGLLLLGACGRTPEGAPAAAAAKPAAEAAHHDDHDDHAQGKDEHAQEKDEHGHAHEDGHGDEHGDEHAGGEADMVRLTDAQVAAAGISVLPVESGFAGALEVPAVLVADPAATGVVATAVGGRVVELRRNLGDAVARGDVLAVIESADVAELQAELASGQRQLELAESTFRREERLLREQVTARQDFDAARTAAQQARIRVDLARQRLAASGGAVDGALNRLAIRAPIKGFVTARQVTLGDVVAPNAELFRVADLGRIAVELSLSPDDAGAVAVGAPVTVSAGKRSAEARVISLSRVVDPATLQVRAVAMLPNGQGLWRIGETARASVPLGAGEGAGQLAVPRSAIQTVEDKPSVFVRVKDGFAVKHLVLGAASGAWVAVTQGLEGGEQVAATNSYILKAELGKGEGGHHDH